MYLLLLGLVINSCMLNAMKCETSSIEIPRKTVYRDGLDENALGVSRQSKLNTSLMRAVYKGEIALAMKLVDAGASLQMYYGTQDVLEDDQFKGFSPLHVALREQHYPIALFLTQMSSTVNQCETRMRNDSPLHLAVRSLLSTYDAYVINPGGFPASLVASNMQIVGALLLKNADISSVNKDGCTIFHVICNDWDVKKRSYIFSEVLKHIFYGQTVLHDYLIDSSSVSLHTKYRTSLGLKIAEIKRVLGVVNTDGKQAIDMVCDIHACAHSHCAARKALHMNKNGLMNLLRTLYVCDIHDVYEDALEEDYDGEVKKLYQANLKGLFW